MPVGPQGSHTGPRRRKEGSGIKKQEKSRPPRQKKRVPDRKRSIFSPKGKKKGDTAAGQQEKSGRSAVLTYPSAPTGERGSGKVPIKDRIPRGLEDIKVLPSEKVKERRLRRLKRLLPARKGESRLPPDPARRRQLLKLWAFVFLLLVVLSVGNIISNPRSNQASARPVNPFVYEDAFASQEQEPDPEPAPAPQEQQPEEPIAYQLREDKSIYADDDPTSVVTMYLTVRPGNAAESTNHTWTEVNTYSKYYFEDLGIDRYKVEAILQVGDENGPLEGEVGYGAVIPNATVQIRGQTSTRYEQKNYKVELKEGMGTWRGQRTLNLNKHEQDGMRFRNKLSYDLMKDVPYMTANRTQFVHLYVKDETDGGSGEFEDYGLFTQVEQINKAYLKARNLDPNGQLYKIEFFEYYRYEDALLQSGDPDFDPEVFQDYLEIKGSNDHSKLIQMLDEVNDYSIPIEETVEKWFDTENLLYWMGFQILMGNEDTQSRNYFLYSPVNVDKFFILSWDNDVSLMATERLIKHDGYQPEGDWRYGISNYWGTVLYSRMYKEKKYRDGLTAAIEDLRANYLTDEKVGALVEKYSQTVRPYVFQEPDLLHIPIDESEFDVIAGSMTSEVGRNYQRYLESLEKPMPFYMGSPTLVQGGSKLEFSWEIAYDFDNEDITYSFTLARDYQYTDIVYQNNTLTVPDVTVDRPGAGTYYIRVVATNESGYSQYAFDYIRHPEYSGVNIFGTKEFTLGEDGSITEFAITE